MTHRLKLALLCVLASLLAAPAWAGQACVFVSKRCVAPNEKRVIDTVEVTRACWQYEETYNCIEPDFLDNCAAIASVPGCRPVDVQCTQFSTIDPTVCLDQTKQFWCADGQPTGDKVKLLDTSYTIVSEVDNAAACASHEQNPSCKKSGVVCIDGPSTKNVNGLDVYRDCWSWNYTYTCRETGAGAVDNCGTIASTPGCSLNTSSCTETSSATGECNEFTKRYWCSDKPADISKVVLLETQYTIVQDYTDNSACLSFENNPACKKTGTACVDGPATKNINGKDVFKECWAWDYTYSCQQTDPNAADYCAAIAATPGCKEQSSACSETSGATGLCNETTKRFWCSDKPVDTTKIILLETSYTIVKDETDASACADYANNPDCVPSSTSCVEGPGTRNINGMDVYKDCWKWSYSYICKGTPTSDCGELDANPKCIFERVAPARTLDGTIDPLVNVRSYTCEVSPASTKTTQVCTTANCVAGVCPADPPVGDTDFSKAVAILETARQGAAYEDKDGLLFTGFRDQCTSNAFLGLRACCKEKVASGGSNTALGTVTRTFVGQAVKYYGTEYVFDPLSGWLQEIGVQMYQGLTSAMATWATDAGYTALADEAATAYLESVSADSLTAGATSTPTPGGSSFSVYGLTFEFSSSGLTFTGFDPYSFAFSVALMVIQSAMQCSPEEQTLSLRRGQRLCVSLGTWTDSGSFSLVTRKTYEGFCCYNSRLARIINEQGRPLVGRPFGSPDSESCKGFTQEEMQRLDFSKLDLSEFIADVTSTAQDNVAGQSRSSGSLNDIVTNYFNTGRPTKPDGNTIPVIKP